VLKTRVVMLMFENGGGAQVPEKGRNKEGKLKAAEVVISRRAHKVETKAPVFIETARRTAVVKGKVKVVHSPRSITVIGWRWTQPQCWQTPTSQLRCRAQSQALTLRAEAEGSNIPSASASAFSLCDSGP
jgi:hypothetical protein